jgi:predicted enzyme related to lactoylglutathione lyase
MKFNNIRLLVQDFDKCFSFYKETLGLTCTHGSQGDNFASFNIGLSDALGIFKAGLMNEAIGKKQKASKETADKFVIVIEVSSVDKTVESLKSKHVKFITDPRDMPVWGIRVAHFRDPENNLIELFSFLKK